MLVVTSDAGAQEAQIADQRMNRNADVSALAGSLAGVPSWRWG